MVKELDQIDKQVRISLGMRPLPSEPPAFWTYRGDLFHPYQVGCTQCVDRWVWDKDSAKYFMAESECSSLPPYLCPN